MRVGVCMCACGCVGGGDYPQQVQYLWSGCSDPSCRKRSLSPPRLHPPIRVLGRIPEYIYIYIYIYIYTKQLAELEPPPSLPTRHPEISPSFLHLLHPSTPPPSGCKHGRLQYIGSDISSDDDENDEDFAFSAVNKPQVSDSDFQIPSITISSAHRPHHFLRRRRERGGDVHY